MSAGVPSSQLGISLATKLPYLQISGAAVLFVSGEHRDTRSGGSWHLGSTVNHLTVV